MKTVIEMAREAGLYTHKEVQPELRLFAQLVAKKAVEAEREACAKAADDQWVRNPNVSGGDAIRARSQHGNG